MGKEDDSGYRAEIPDDALAEALQSIENIERGKDGPQPTPPSDDDDGGGQTGQGGAGSDVGTSVA